MALPHFIVKCHGVNASTEPFFVPANTYIITVTAAGITLKDVMVKMDNVTRDILKEADPVAAPMELFEGGNTTTRKTEACKGIEAYLRRRVETTQADGKVVVTEHGDPNINIRIHIPHTRLPNMKLTTEEPDAVQKRLFGIYSKYPGIPAMVDNTSEINMTLSELVRRKTGVYILFVCRKDEGLLMFEQQFKENPDFKLLVNAFLLFKQREEHTRADAMIKELPFPLKEIFIHIAKNPTLKNIQEAMAYLKDEPPPSVVLARKDSSTTDTIETEAQVILQEIKKLQAAKRAELQKEIDKFTSVELRRNQKPDILRYFDATIAKLRSEMASIKPPSMPEIIRSVYNHSGDVEGGKKRRKTRRRKTKRKP